MSDIDTTVEVGETTTNDVSGNVKPATTELATQVTGETPADTEDEQPERGKPEAAVQKAINRLTRQRGEAERRAIAAEARLEALQDLAKPAPAAKGGEPQKGDFASYEDYLDARADYRADLKAQEVLKTVRAETTGRTAEQELTARFQSFATEAEKQAKDLGKDFKEDWQTLGEAPKVSITVRDFLLDADHKAGMVSFLADNPDELARISDLPAVAAAKELTKLEARIGAKAPSRSTRTPAPPPTVSGRSTASVDLSKITNMDEYAKARGFAK